MNLFKTLNLTEDEQLQYECEILAHLLFMVNPEIDEFEAAEIVYEFAKDQAIDFINSDLLSKLVLTTKFNPKKDVMN